MALDKVQLLTAWFSPYGMRVLLALKLKNVPFELVQENLGNKSSLLLESNPIYKKVPVLIHNGKPICESSIILQYIDSVWPSPVPLVPKDPYELAQARFWLEYIERKLYDAGSRTIRAPEGEKQEQAKKDLVEALQTLDKALEELSKGGIFFGGQQIGLVDVAFAPFMCWFDAFDTVGGFKVWEECKCDRLLKWTGDMGQVPVVKEVLSVAPSHRIVEQAFHLRKLALRGQAISQSA